jgi:hypothetical protein
MTNDQIIEACKRGRVVESNGHTYRMKRGGIFDVTDPEHETRVSLPRGGEPIHPGSELPKSGPDQGLLMKPTRKIM